jgi:hypothetical protein
MNEDDFKRASLRGRGWKIMRGEDKSLQDEQESGTSFEETPSKLRLTPEEIDDVLGSVPPSLGTMPPAATDAPIYDDVFEQEQSASRFLSESRPITSESFDPRDEADDDLAFYIDDEPLSDFDGLTSEDERMAELEFGVDDLLDEPDLLPLDDGDEMAVYGSYERGDAGDVIATQEASRESITGIFEAEEFIPEALSEVEQAELESEISDTKSLTDMLMTDELRSEDLDVYQSETLLADELTAANEVDDFLDDSELDELVLETATPDTEVDDPYGTTQFDPYETTAVDMVITNDDTFIPLGDEVDDDAAFQDTDYGDEETYVVSRVDAAIVIEAIPAAEDTESVDAVNLTDVVPQIERRVEALVPEIPEINVVDENQPDPAFGAFNLFDDPSDEVFASEGVGPSGSSRTREGMPLVEDLDKPRAVRLEGATRRPSVIHDLTPLEPEVRSKSRTRTQMEDKGSGGIYVDEKSGGMELESPFGDQKVRPRATDLFTPTRPADGSMLDQFVDETRLRELWDLIEALQDDVVEQITGDRERTDVYQQELLVASGLLLESRENYDDARAIAYRIRADLNRDRKVAEDTRRYRPLVLNYVVGWGIALVLLALMNGLVKNVADNIQAPFFAASYLPSVFGGAGGLFLAYSTLHKHTAVRRDFDSIHIPWYLFSPLVGGLMGFLVFLISVAVVTTTVTQDITDPATLGSSPVVIWALAFIGGMQQNWVISWLQSLRGRISGNDSDATDST